jgi:hypothetical protein
MSAYRWASCVYPKHFLYEEVSLEVIQNINLVSDGNLPCWSKS